MKERLPRPRQQVQWFARLMERELQENDDKGGWETCPDDYLVRRIDDERAELARLLRKLQRKIDRDVDLTPAEVEQVLSEAADVANFAMMIADNWKANLEDPIDE